jgi:uncharacterized protein (DUF736 family)
VAFEQKDLSGALFVNDDKQGNQPDFKGNAVIGGQKYFVSAWKRKSKAGKPFISLAFDLPRQQQNPTQAPEPAAYEPDDPFGI